jgi:hypothetical protein
MARRTCNIKTTSGCSVSSGDSHSTKASDGVGRGEIRHGSRYVWRGKGGAIGSGCQPASRCRIAAYGERMGRARLDCAMPWRAGDGA